MPKQILSDEEMKALVLGAMKAAGEEGIAEEELVRIMEWAENVRIEGVLLKLALEGKLSARWHPDKPDIEFKSNLYKKP